MVIDLPISHVFMRPDARKINDDGVRALVASIREIGIINPLRVRPAQRYVEGVLADAYELIAGAHRLKAARKIGLDAIPCVVVNDDDLHAELAMIDENLCRAELSPADRAAQTARRKAIYETLHPETRHGVIGNGREKSCQVGDSTSETVARFTADTAEKIGKSERAVQRDAERGEKVAPDVLARVRGTSLDSGAYLDRLKALPPDEQRARVERALAAPVIKPTQRALTDAEAVEKQFQAIVAAWNKAVPEARDRFKVEYVEAPVMDARFG